jgi:hypothetical protein
MPYSTNIVEGEFSEVRIAPVQLLETAEVQLQQPKTMAILGSNMVVGGTLSLLLEGHGYQTILLDSYPTGIVDELLERRSSSYAAS